MAKSLYNAKRKLLLDGAVAREKRERVFFDIEPREKRKKRRRGYDEDNLRCSRRVAIDICCFCSRRQALGVRDEKSRRIHDSYERERERGKQQVELQLRVTYASTR